jgi:hypothetical protein
MPMPIKSFAKLILVSAVLFQGLSGIAVADYKVR